MKKLLFLVKGCKVKELRKKLNEKMEGVMSMELPETMYEVYFQGQKAERIGTCYQCCKEITTFDEGYIFEDDITIHSDCLRDYMEKYKIR